MLGVDHKTVISVRESLERTGEIPQLKKTVGRDGKARKKPERRHIPTQHIPKEADVGEALSFAKAVCQKKTKWLAGKFEFSSREENLTWSWRTALGCLG